jgi:hypothetical protein
MVHVGDTPRAVELGGVVDGGHGPDPAELVADQSWAGRLREAVQGALRGEDLAEARTQGEQLVQHFAGLVATAAAAGPGGLPEAPWAGNLAIQVMGALQVDPRLPSTVGPTLAAPWIGPGTAVAVVPSVLPPNTGSATDPAHSAGSGAGGDRTPNGGPIPDEHDQTPDGPRTLDASLEAGEARAQWVGELRAAVNAAIRGDVEVGLVVGQGGGTGTLAQQIASVVVSAATSGSTGQAGMARSLLSTLGETPARSPRATTAPPRPRRT